MNFHANKQKGSGKPKGINPSDSIYSVIDISNINIDLRKIKEALAKLDISQMARNIIINEKYNYEFINGSYHPNEVTINQLR